MISRYSRKELTSIWSEENKYKIWLNVEIAAAQAMEKLGYIPKGVSATVKKKGRINVKRIHAIESKVKHDVIAFLSSITEKAGIKARYLHQGMTSSDVLDTSFNMQLVQSGKILLKDINHILNVLKKQAKKYKLTPCIGRSHGIHAEPLTFGLKLASFYEEFKRNKKRLEIAINEVSTCAISGSVGTFANINPNVEKHVAKKLSLKVEPISTQIIPRDRHAFYFSVLGIIAGSVERVATEIRHLQRTEVYELQEYFSKKQKGSSAMPHKKNPILSENLTGLSRMVRSYVVPALENIALWHERDISHSSVERNIGPDANITLDFALVRLSEVLKNMIVYPKKMATNLNITKGIIFSQELMLELTKSGLSREKSYRIVQSHAKKCLSQNLNLFEVVIKDNLITNKIPLNKLKKIFNYSSHFKNVNLIFSRVFK
ncbi:MAG TPA: adenylosuccinate lyase [Candidatus Pelagibacter bacterium]|jgi:adenylosuccinate lyase|nr:adenylosuccinate lyase [Pelagibacteraceae bacterium]HJN84092.1 adenylosuccinate lyase [Candidatus Pelagibacter bacterium]|tara:strand:- start:170 stop:1462 length:1293 start_codon:yes stop_codon:yes gene_type:complete